MKPYNLTFSAGQTIPVVMPGNHLRVVSGDDEIKIDIPELGMSGLTIEKGLAITLPKKWNDVRISSETAQSVRILCGDGYSFDSRLAGEVSIDGTVNVMPEPSNLIFSTMPLPGGMGIQLMSASAPRKEVTIMFTADTWIKENNLVAVGTGFPVKANVAITMEHNGDLWVWPTAACTASFIEHRI